MVYATGEATGEATEGLWKHVRIQPVYNVQFTEYNFLVRILREREGGGRPHKMQEKHGQPRVVEKGKEGRGRGWREAHPVIHTDGSAGEQVLADGVVTKL